MSNPISGTAGRASITAPGATPETPPAGAGSPTKLLYGTATPELTSMLERLKQLPLTAQAAVRASNPELQ
jgi:hypothetical protein